LLRGDVPFDNFGVRGTTVQGVTDDIGTHDTGGVADEFDDVAEGNGCGDTQGIVKYRNRCKSNSSSEGEALLHCVKKNDNDAPAKIVNGVFIFSFLFYLRLALLIWVISKALFSSRSKDRSKAASS